MITNRQWKNCSSNSSDRKCEECAGKMSGVALKDGTCNGFSKRRVMFS
jgi:hypothetical protein